jgi:type II secretory pathway pseudopilin PulG
MCDAEAFMGESNGQRRFRLSIRTLMIAVALCALLLALAAWTVRQAQMRAMLERAMAAEREAQALLARDLAQREAAQNTLAVAKLGTVDQQKTGTLWAGLTINHPIFRADQTKDVKIEFTLVNDGDKVIDPKIPESRIVINGKELGDSGLILRSVPREARSQALSPGATLQFDCPLGDHFKEPGIYRVSWRGAGFQSPEIVIRILPEETR